MTDTQAPCPPTCDIFCHVIDNFGDAGVCWRLARALSDEGLRPTLYIDDLATLSRLVPEVRPDIRDGQTARSVRILGWEQCLGNTPSDCVIETFGCRLPDAFEEAIARRVSEGRACLWLNLEYLSAEDWVEECHGLPSPHPRLPVTKTFLFPGFTDKTGGVIIERTLEEERQAFGRSEQESFLRSLGAEPDDGAFRLFFFSYPSAPAERLAQSLAADPRPVHVLAAPGAASEALRRALAAIAAPQVKVTLLPAVPQERFDRLLWCADALIIRGEDSFVRAQLAQKPFLWTIYPQEGDTHIVKLNAFIDRVAARAAGSPGALLWRELQNRWNLGTWESGDWKRFRDAAPALADAARDWAGHLRGLGSLSERIASLVKKQVQ